jgi:hypothetical protein
MPGRQVMCKQCLAVIEIPEGTDPPALTWCGCCPENHHHGKGAAACTSEKNHPGQPCWNPPQHPVRPEGCLVCRPVMHFVVAGQMQFTSGTAPLVTGGDPR